VQHRFLDSDGLPSYNDLDILLTLYPNPEFRVSEEYEVLLLVYKHRYICVCDLHMLFIFLTFPVFPLCNITQFRYVRPVMTVAGVGLMAYGIYAIFTFLYGSPQDNSLVFAKVYWSLFFASFCLLLFR
jgi:hypothetical protein